MFGEPRKCSYKVQANKYYTYRFDTFCLISVTCIAETKGLPAKLDGSNLEEKFRVAE